MKNLKILSRQRLVQLGVIFFWTCLYVLSSQAGESPVQVFKPQAMSIKQASSLFSADKSAYWVASRKYDGVRAIWDGRSLRTKQGNQIYAPAAFIEQLPDFALDGELWIEIGKFTLANQMVLSSLNGEPGQGELWRRVTYQIFEVPNIQGGLLRRLTKLQRYLEKRNVSQVKIIKQQPVSNIEQLEAFYQQVVSIGGEGIVVRDARQSYQTGRLSSVIKIKPKSEAECIVRGYIPGKGRLQGFVGALRCQLLDGQKARLFPQLPAKRETMIRIGSGLSDQERQSPPKIGAVVTFQYSGHTKTGLPRFAVYLRQRYPAE